jgi:hypothetical protein
MTTPAAIKKALDASPHDEQAVSLNYITRIDGLMRAYPELRIKIMWLPKSCPFVGFRRAKQLALEAIRTADLSEVTEPQTLKSQKAGAKQQVLHEWAERRNQSPRTSFAYQTALRPHETPRWKATPGLLGRTRIFHTTKHRRCRPPKPGSEEN